MAKVNDGRRNNGGRREGAGRKKSAEEFDNQLIRRLAALSQPHVETPKSQPRAEKQKVQDGRCSNGGRRPGAGRKRKSAETNPDPLALLTPEAKALFNLLRGGSAPSSEMVATVYVQASVTEHAQPLSQTVGSQTEKRRRGGQPGREKFDRAAFLIDLDNAIDDLFAKGTKTRNITRKFIARNYRLGGEYVSPDNITKRLRRSGVKLEFSEYVESRQRVKP